MATIYDVAKAAGVSPKTVSRVLNSDAPVSQETRRAVETAMTTLGYVPSNAARMMRSSKSGLIGLITGAISQNGARDEPRGLPDLLIVQGMQRVIAASGKTLMIADTGGQFDRVPQLVRTFAQHRAEGLAYVADYHQKVSLPPVQGAPLILVNCFDTQGTPAILPDDRRGERDLVARLIRAGHSRIGFLTLRPGMTATELRLAGYNDALHEAGLPFDPALVITGMHDDRLLDVQVLWDAIDRLVSLPDPPTVLCCGNDEMAMRVYGLLRTRGIRVPEDLSVAGYDNYRVIAETLFPQLTTVELSYAAMGARAGERLLAMIDGNDTQAEQTTLVSGPVCWRDSVTTQNTVQFTKFQGRNVT